MSRQRRKQRRASAPRPNRVSRVLTDIRKNTDEVEELDRWAANIAHNFGNSSDPEALRKGGVADPTGDLVASKSKEGLRYLRDTAFEKILHAHKSLNAAKRILEIASQFDPFAEPKEDRPISVSRKQLQEALSAKERRTARGEGYGES